MFGLLRNLYNWYRSRGEKVVKFALIGIDNAGKTTILHRLKGEVPEFITPTIGFASETLEQGKYHIKVFDLGGGGNIRTIWSSYYAEIHGAIFVVDSADKNRLGLARDVLHNALEHPRLQKKPLLIFSNKQDLPDALSGPDISQELGLEKFTDYSYNIVSCSAVFASESGGQPDPNIIEGLKWILGMVDKNFTALERRIQQDVAEQQEQDRIEKEEKKKRIEAMKRERELERERQEKEEAMKASETATPELPNTPRQETASLIDSKKSQSIIEVHSPMESGPPNIPMSDGISMTKDDLKLPTIASNPSKKNLSFSRHSPRSSSVAPLPTSESSTNPESTAFTPRSAWSSAAHVPPTSAKKKLDPLISPSPSISSLGT